MTPEDQEEFTSAVVLRFIENNYEVFRRFRGDCSLRAFLATVVMRYLFESRDQAWGRWRPSKCARRLGSAAVYLETLVHRDRTPLPEAIALVSNHPRWALSTGAVRALYAQLPERPPRCRRVAQLDTAVHRVSNGDLTPAELDERRRETVRLRTALAAALSALAPNERRLLRLHFVERLSILAIARTANVDAHALYRHVSRILRRLRIELQAREVTSRGVGRLLGHAGSELDSLLAARTDRIGDRDATTTSQVRLMRAS